MRPSDLDAQIVIRVSPDAKRKLVELAETEGRTLSQQVRWMLRPWIRDDQP